MDPGPRDARSMKMELISTGRELLNGRTVNRHAYTIGQWLREFGQILHTDTTVTDDLGRIAEEFSDALTRSDVIFVTGGLGPTSDDITRDALASVLGCSIIKHAPTVEFIRSEYTKRGRVLNELSERQALVLDGAEVLSNRVGMAPGEKFVHKNTIVFILPGPPSELRAVGEDHVIPWLREQFPQASTIQHRVFMTTGIGESDVVTQLKDGGFSEDGLTVSYRAAIGVVEISLTAEKDHQALSRAAGIVEHVLGPYIFATEKCSLAEAVGRQLAERGQTLALAESCTGGLLGHQITSVPGSSAYFRGGCVTYSNEIKHALLNVSLEDLETHGAVSETVARQMAEGVRVRLNADWGVGITGIAGPGGGTPEKPVGLVYIGVANSEGVTVARKEFHADRQGVKDRACLHALNLLRKAIAGP